MAGAPLAARNPRLARLRKLVARRSERVKTGLVPLDGPVLLAEALRSPVEVVEVYRDVDAPHAIDADSNDLLAARGVPVLEVAGGVVARIADPVSPQPVVSLVRRPDTAPASVTDTWTGMVLVLVDLSDPGNVGTLIRCAEAAGAEAVIAVGSTSDPFGPKALRASAGSALRVPVIEVPKLSQTMDLIASAGASIVATASGGHTRAVSLDEARLSSPLAIVLGSEAHGLPDEVLDRAHQVVTVPMAGQVESLSVSTAGAVLAFEIARRERGKGAGHRGPGL